MLFCATHFMSFLISWGRMNDNARIISINSIVRDTRTLHRKYRSCDIRMRRKLRIGACYINPQAVACRQTKRVIRKTES